MMFLVVQHDAFFVIGMDQFDGTDVSGSVWELCNIYRHDACMPACSFLLGLMLPSAKVQERTSVSVSLVPMSCEALQQSLSSCTL